MLLTAELLLNYERCPRRAFLDTHGDSSRKAAPNDFLLKLAQDSSSHKRMVLADQVWHRPQYQPGDWATGASATLDLMQQGVEQIRQGVLLVEDAQGLTFLSSPDLLTKQPGHSYFGDWSYAPTDIRLGKRPKLGYQIVVAFHVKLLAIIQGAWPEAAGIFLRDRGLYAVDLWQFVPQMQTILAELSHMLLQRQEPEVFIARNRCSLCAWLNHCHAIAESQQHLSLLPGVTSSRYPLLQQLNLMSVEALATADLNQLQPLFGREVGLKLIQQAQAVVQKQAILLQRSLPQLSCAIDGFVDTPVLTQPVRQTYTPTIQAPPALRIPTATTELYFDIEAEPGLNLAYLHGVLVVDHPAKTQTFYPFLAEHPENESLIWQQFLDLVQAYPTAPIFHFCSYEIHTVERLAKLYQTPRQVVKPLLGRFVDLHQWVTQTVALPVESYTLKMIARWLGFQWRDRDASGAQSIYWYSQWLKTGDRTFLEAILRYNEDDCRATYYVKDWLANFIQRGS